MPSSAAKKPAVVTPNTAPSKPVPSPHLAANEHEAKVTEFEQALICAAEAFYRWGGALLGPEGREYNLTGQDCVILQQLVAARTPRRVSDLARFANRDDPSNIQYSIKKLAAAGLIRKAQASSHRDTAYEVTEAAKTVTDRLLNARRELLMQPTASLQGIMDKLNEATQALGLLTGLYEHGARVVARRS